VRLRTPVVAERVVVGPAHLVVQVGTPPHEHQAVAERDLGDRLAQVPAHVRVEAPRGEAGRHEDGALVFQAVVDERRDTTRHVLTRLHDDLARPGRLPRQERGPDPPAPPARVHPALQEGSDRPLVPRCDADERVRADVAGSVHAPEGVACRVLPVTLEVLPHLLGGGAVREGIGLLDPGDEPGQSQGVRGLERAPREPQAAVGEPDLPRRAGVGERGRRRSQARGRRRRRAHGDDDTYSPAP